MSSVEVRAINRRLEELQSIINSIPTNPASASSYASAHVVDEVQLKLVDLENKYNALKKYLEESLEKIAVLEKKLLELESKVCMCTKSDASVSSDDDIKPTSVSLAENPVFEVQEDSKLEDVPEEELPEEEEHEDEA
jgi:hypothetical protein